MLSLQVKESAKLRAGPVIPCRKLTEIIINTASILIEENARLTICEILNILQTAAGTTYDLLTEILDLSLVCANWISCLLTSEHKVNRIWICKEWLAWNLV